MAPPIEIVGAGFAGAECAFQLAERGIHVVLWEMRPVRSTPVHKSSDFAELVCSNSLRSDNPESAVGLLHAELRRVGSLILSSADSNRVPAGDALAVERLGFSAEIEQRLKSHPNITIEAGEVTAVPEGLVAWTIGLGALVLVARWLGSVQADDVDPDDA